MSNLNKPTTLSITNHGVTVSVSFDHSDLTIGELFEAFKAAMIGITFSEDQIRDHVMQLAYEWENMMGN
jgi:hypothetical protein